MNFSNLLYQIDPNSMILSIFFIITFTLLMFILGRTIFKKNNSTKTIIALCVSLLATYGLNRMNLNLDNFVFNLGISENLLYIIAPILILLFVFFMSRKKNPETQKRSFSFGRFLIILGALMLILGFTPLIYSKAFFIGVGAGLIALGGIIVLKKKKNLNFRGSRRRRDNSKQYRREQEKNQKHQQKLAEKQSRWQRKQQEKEIRRRAQKINKIKNRRERLQAEKDLKKQQQDNAWAQEQQKENLARKNQQEKEQRMYEQQKRKKEIQDQKWAQEQIKQANRQRARQAREQRSYEMKQLRSLYDKKYDEATEQQRLITLQVPGARERYLRLQKELQEIVNKMNKL